MHTEPRTQGSPAEANGKLEHALISEAKARQLLELALELRARGEQADSLSSWLSARVAMLASVMADLRGGDRVLTEVPLGELLPLPVEQRWATGADLADLIVESLSTATQDRLRSNGRVSAIFLPSTNGDAIVAEARTLASEARLPVLFVDHAPVEKQPACQNGSDAMPSIPVDASDVIAIYRVAHEAIARARCGSGPTHIHCVHWQIAGNRNRETSSEDAVERLQQWLTARGFAAQAWCETFAARRQTAKGPAAAGPHSEPATAERSRFAPDRQRFAQPDIQTN